MGINNESDKYLERLKISNQNRIHHIDLVWKISGYFT